MGRYLAPMTQEFLNWWFSHLPLSYTLRLLLDQPRDYRAFYHVDKYTSEVRTHQNIKTYPYPGLFGSPFLQRVHELEMLLPESDLAMLNRTHTRSLENLESVTISTTRPPGFYYQTWTVGAFPPAPRLTRLNISYSRLLSTFPTRQLSQLCITEGITPSFLRNTLTVTCPNLVYANFNLESPTPFVPSPFPPPFMPPPFPPTQPLPIQLSAPLDSTVRNLRYLTLSHSTFTQVAQTHHGLTMPSLHALRLHKTIIRRGTISYEVLTRYLETYPSLVELYLDQTFFPVPIVFDHSTDFSRYQNLMEVLPQLGRVVLELDYGIKNERARDFYKQVILSTWIRPTNGPQGGRLEIQLPPRDGRPPSDYFLEDKLIGEVAAYWKKRRAQLCCDVIFRQASRKTFT